MASITYIGPHDAVEVDGLGVVKRGETVDCPPEIANGTKATGKPFLDVKTGEETDDDTGAENPLYHPGFAGLLAQSDNWKRATGKKGDDS